MNSRWPALTGLTGLALAGSLVVATGAFATSPPSDSSPVWSSANTSTTGCPSSMHLLTPNRPQSFFASRPDALLLLPFHDSSGATSRLLKDVASHPMHWLSTVSCKVGRPGQAAPTTSNADLSFANWSGYQSSINSRGYIGATMEWPIHALTNPAGGTATSSTWPGLGKGNSAADSLIQAGIEQDLACNGAGGSCSAQTNIPWLEIYPQEAEQEITNLTVNVLDLVGVIVEYDPLTGQAYFEIDDLSTNTGVYGYDTVQSGGGSGSQVEWIVERPKVCFITCDFTTLPNFGTQPIIAAESADGLWQQPTYRTISDDGPQSIRMQSCNGGTVLANPGSITNTEDFTVTWQAAGQYELC